jgi:hypothetical protein
MEALTPEYHEEFFFACSFFAVSAAGHCHSAAA